MFISLLIQNSNSTLFQPSMCCTLQRGGKAESPSTCSSLLQNSSTTRLSSIRGGNQMCAKLSGRKRPAMLEIPPSFNSEVGLQTCRFAAKVDDEVVMEDEGDGFYSVCCKRGRRGSMEDRFSAFVSAENGSTLAFFGVYDGHGGTKAANFVSSNLGRNVMAEVSSVREEEGIDAAVRNGYLTTDTEFLEKSVDSGACCVTALIRGDNLVVSNVGDCRAVLSLDGIAEVLTSDHQPSRADERDRVEVLGGYVDCRNGVWRLQGSLAVTRAIGDRHLKQWVIAEPETKRLKLHPGHEFLILASDGLWDKVSNQEAVDAIRSKFLNVDSPDSFSACKKLVDLAAARGSLDDISVMIIQLRFLFHGGGRRKLFT